VKKSGDAISSRYIAAVALPVQAPVLQMLHPWIRLIWVNCWMQVSSALSIVVTYIRRYDRTKQLELALRWPVEGVAQNHTLSARIKDVYFICY
jgi:hypothetical protein